MTDGGGVADGGVRILVAYHSSGNHVAELAREIAAGVGEVEQAECEALSVAEADPLSVSEYDGIILGAPTRYGTISAAMKLWLEDAYPVWDRKEMIGRVGGSFTVSAGPCGDKALTLQALNHVLLMFGCVVVGNPPSEANHDVFAGAGAKAHDLARAGFLLTDEDRLRAREFGRHFAAVTRKLRD